MQYGSTKFNSVWKLLIWKEYRQKIWTDMTRHGMACHLLSNITDAQQPPRWQPDYDLSSTDKIMTSLASSYLESALAICLYLLSQDPT